MLMELIKSMGFNLVPFFVDSAENTKDDRALFFLENPEVIMANKQLLEKLNITTREEKIAFVNGIIAALVPFALNRLDARSLIEDELMATLYNLLSE
jgi:hypothetical protein